MDICEVGTELLVNSAENLKDGAGDFSLLGLEIDSNCSVPREWLWSIVGVFAPKG